MQVDEPAIPLPDPGDAAADGSRGSWRNEDHNRRTGE
jgi:hypothetical protein